MVENLILITIFVALLFFYVWNELHHKRVVNSLLEKLMARDYSEYKVMSRNTTKKEVKDGKEAKEEVKVIVDPCLGKNF